MSKKMCSKNILFLSALDFKKKSIKVLEITPAHYAKKGWNVYYIVARNESKYDNYFYEQIIDPEGVNVERFLYPFKNMIDRQKKLILRLMLQKIANWFVVLLLSIKGILYIKNNNVDIVYGYEVHGVLASKIIKVFFFYNKKIKYVSRFQGTFYITHYLNNKNWFKILTNFDHVLSLYLPSNLCIMTNDGTNGNLTLKRIKSRNQFNLRFWTNGVDCQKISDVSRIDFKEKLSLKNQYVFVSISRLEKWKKVDRCIKLVDCLVHKKNIQNLRYFIIGDGADKNYFENLTKKLLLTEYIEYVGAIDQGMVKYYLNISDYFLSFYDVSNVGNPLWEAISANKIIITLDNGDTKRWIQHKKNGFIYDHKICDTENFYEMIAEDIIASMNDENIRKEIKQNILNTEKKHLWSWDERMNAEIEEINKLINV